MPILLIGGLLFELFNLLLTYTEFGGKVFTSYPLRVADITSCARALDVTWVGDSAIYEEPQSFQDLLASNPNSTNWSPLDVALFELVTAIHQGLHVVSELVVPLIINFN